MEHPTFEFDGGLCHVMEDKIVFNQSSNPEERYGLSEVSPAGRALNQVIILIFVLALVLSLAFRDVFEDTGVFFLFLIGFLVFKWFYEKGISHTQVIPIENLLYVNYRTQKLGKPEGYFVFHFKDGNGNKRRRFLYMKSFESGAGQTIEEAKSLFTTRGLLQA